MGLGQYRSGLALHEDQVRERYESDSSSDVHRLLGTGCKRYESNLSRCASANTQTGFFHSIALSPGKSLQDTLRLLTLWFNYGHQSDVSAAMQEGLGSVSIDTWLEVIPQVCRTSLHLDYADQIIRTADRSALCASYQCATLGTANARRHRSSASTSIGLCFDRCKQIS